MLNKLTLSDQPDRDRIATDLNTNLFVDAGAGSGKTKAMVSRICALVDSGIPLSAIVAITFTDKAAAELRNRIRRELSQVELSSELRRAALDDLDSAPIGTIHSFAGRLLRENPIEAGVPPILTISDELASQLAFTARWEQAREFLFTNDKARGAIDVLISLGVTLGQLESVAQSLDSNWERLDADTPIPTFTLPDYAPLLFKIDELIGMRELCKKPDVDSAVKRLNEAEAWVSTMRELLASIDKQQALPVRAVEHLAAFKLPGGERFGSKSNWNEADLFAVRDARQSILDEIASALKALISTCVQLVIAVLIQTIVRSAIERQESGFLEFSDLLVLATRLVTSNEDVWRRVTARYQTIMLDEFQDTDPVQAELAVRLASVAWIGDGDWTTAPLRAGALFTVGDPKQSIYRFRQADIATFMAMGDRMHDQVTLSTNFRSSKPVLTWINNVFGDLIVKDDDRQPHFVPLDARSDRPQWDESFGPAITLIGQGACASNADAARDAEAHDVARLIREAVGLTAGKPGWTHQYLDDHTKAWVTRPLTLDDVTVLLPSRTALPAIQKSLDAADIEFIAEASSLVYSSAEVLDLLTAAQAIANTADQAALVVALRSPIFGCSDAELLEWSANGGRWTVFQRDVSADSEYRVGRSLALIKSLIEELPTLTPSELLQRLIVERQIFEMQLDTPRYSREAWRRMRYIVDQAEAWHENTHGSLRDYLAWATLQQADNARVKEAVVPEKGVEAVHIMTIHASKGLEFPMVIVAGASGHSANDRGGTVAWATGGKPEAQFLATDAKGAGLAVATAGFETASKREFEFLVAEITRLLYVACTRAETHLAVSLHQVESSSSASGKQKPSLSDLFLRSLAVTIGADSFTAPDDEITPGIPVHHEAPVLATSDEEWAEMREQWMARASKPASWSITSLAKHAEEAPIANPFAGDAALVFVPEEYSAPRAEKPRARVRFIDPEEEETQASSEPGDEAPPEFDGTQTVGSSARTGLGARTGTAVHRTLELSNLTLSDQLTEHARAAAVASEIMDWKHVADLAANALNTDVIKRAAEREHWLELPMTYSAEGIVLEGVADLIYREDDGSLVIVDFKTDKTLNAETLEGYWAQLSAYANMIHGATGESVSALQLIHCSQSPAQVITAQLST